MITLARLEAIVRTFQTHDVRFLVAGGVAVNAFAHFLLQEKRRRGLPYFDPYTGQLVRAPS